MPEIEATPTMSFSCVAGTFRRGIPVVVDCDDPNIAALLKARYFVSTSQAEEHEDDSVDLADTDRLPDPGLGLGRGRPAKKTQKKAVSNGTGEIESGADHRDSPAPDTAPGAQDDS
jgi:hypothetical protein